MNQLTSLPTHPKFENLTGQRFGRLMVVSYAGKTKKHRWNCQCECGGKTTTYTFNLKNGSAKSCGCLNKERVKETHTKHGQAANYSTSSEYRSYSGAKSRCNNPNDKAYTLYGGRGIEFRFNSFQEFIDEVGKKPSPAFSIDRIDNNGHYEKGNLRWATKKEQGNNIRRNRSLNIGDVTKTVIEWSVEYGIKPITITTRIDRAGWCNSCAVTLPNQKSKRSVCVHNQK